MSQEKSNRQYFCCPQEKTLAWQGIQHLWRAGLLCDATLVAEGRSFQVHRCYLASSSDYFCTMFTSGFRETTEKRIEMKGVTSKGLEAIMDYMYTGTFEICRENVTDILEASSLMQFHDVYKFCVKYLKDCVSLHNCLHFLKITEFYSLEKNRSAIMKLIVKNLAAVAQQPEFLNIDVGFLCELMGSDMLNVETELTLFTVALKWLKHKPERFCHAERVLGLVRFGLMTRKEMDEANAVLTREHKMLPACRNILRGALQYHMNLFGQPTMCTSIAHPRSCIDAFVVFGGQHNHDMVRLNKSIFACGVDSNKLAGFTSIGQMPSAPCNAAVAVMNNFIFVAGGKTSSVVPRLDPTSMTVSSSVYRYNPVDAKWLQLASMDIPRSHFVLVALSDSLMAVGGSIGAVLTDSVEQYDIEENKWSEAPSIPSPVDSHAGCAHEGVMYISGGLEEDPSLVVRNQLLCYDPNGQIWQVKQPMNAMRCCHAMVPYRNKIYVCGGSVGYIDVWESVLSTEVYDIVVDQWTNVSPMPVGRDISSVVLSTSSIFILGGNFVDNDEPTDTILRYDIEKDEWISLHTRIPHALTGLSAAFVKIPLKVYRNSTVS